VRRVAGLDIAVAVALTAFMVLVSVAGRVYQPNARPVSALGIALLVACGAAFTLRRQAPRTSFAAVIACVTAYLAWGFAGWAVYLAAVAGLAGLIFAVPQRRRWIPLAVVAGAALAAATGRPEGWDPMRMLTVAAAWTVIATFGWRTARTRRRLTEQDAAARVVEERLRIARELHDVLSHSLATVSLRAGIGLHLLDRQPEEARKALAAIRSISNDALVKARAALSAVRAERDVDVPGLADLEPLAASVRDAGVAVELDVTAADGTVPAVVATTAYQVVQEALTNVLRHAGTGATARVGVHVLGDWLEIDVTDDGIGGQACGQPTGHGLAGMAERVAGVGGRLRTGPEPAAGFGVRARLPLAGAR
jgi:signal transduction histidine kinase